MVKLLYSCIFVYFICFIAAFHNIFVNFRTTTPTLYSGLFVVVLKVAVCLINCCEFSIKILTWLTSTKSLKYLSILALVRYLSLRSNILFGASPPDPSLSTLASLALSSSCLLSSSKTWCL